MAFKVTQTEEFPPVDKISCTRLGQMCEFMLNGEPVFVIRAQDALAIRAVHLYKDLVKETGAKIEERVDKQLDRMEKWQQLNPDRVKIPD